MPFGLKRAAHDGHHSFDLAVPPPLVRDGDSPGLVLGRGWGGERAPVGLPILSYSTQPGGSTGASSTCEASS